MKITLEGKQGPWQYESLTGEIAHEEIQDGESIPFAVHPLTPQLAGTEFEGILLKPEDSISKQLVEFEFGIGANHQQYAGLAKSLARRGLNVALHKTPPMRSIEKPSLQDLIHAKRRKALLRHAAYLVKFAQNPYVHDSMAAGALADAAYEYAHDELDFEFDGVIDYAHSKGGLPMIIHANFDERVVALYADAISGAVDRNALINHTESVIPIFGDIKEIMSGLSEDDKPEMIEQFKNNKLLNIAQLAGLVIGRRPEITTGLKTLEANQERDVPVIYVSRANDNIFKVKDTVKAGEKWKNLGYIAHHEPVPNSTHHAPINQPDEAADLFMRLMLQQLALRDERIAS